MRARRWWGALALVVPAGFATLWIFLATASARVNDASAQLEDAEGESVGVVTLHQLPGVISRISWTLHGLPMGFHGFHVGVGDTCDPADGFSSAGAHYDPLDRPHGLEDGDLPVVSVNDDGTAEGMLVTDHFEVGDVVGMTMVVTDRPDNYANVPVGDGPVRYTPNGPGAVTDTQTGGNAGPGIACGVITESD